MLVCVYTYQNATLLEITCRGSHIFECHNTSSSENYAGQFKQEGQLAGLLPT